MQTQTQVTAEMIQQSLNNFFDRGGRLVEDEPVYVSEPEPEPTPESEPEMEETVNESEPEPEVMPEPVALSIHDQCKAEADKNIKLEWVRSHYGLNSPSKMPSRKKSQPKPSVIVRARSYHKLNPEEVVARVW